jgi:hypothetical protein
MSTPPETPYTTPLTTPPESFSEGDNRTTRTRPDDGRTPVDDDEGYDDGSSSAKFANLRRNNETDVTGNDSPATIRNDLGPAYGRVGPVDPDEDPRTVPTPRPAPVAPQHPSPAPPAEAPRTANPELQNRLATFVAEYEALAAKFLAVRGECPIPDPSELYMLRVIADRIQLDIKPSTDPHLPPQQVAKLVVEDPSSGEVLTHDLRYSSDAAELKTVLAVDSTWLEQYEEAGAERLPDALRAVAAIRETNLSQLQDGEFDPELRPSVHAMQARAESYARNNPSATPEEIRDYVLDRMTSLASLGRHIQNGKAPEPRPPRTAPTTAPPTPAPEHPAAEPKLRGIDRIKAWISLGNLAVTFRTGDELKGKPVVFGDDRDSLPRPWVEQGEVPATPPATPQPTAEGGPAGRSKLSFDEAMSWLVASKNTLVAKGSERLRDSRLEQLGIQLKRIAHDVSNKGPWVWRELTPRKQLVIVALGLVVTSGLIAEGISLLSDVHSSGAGLPVPVGAGRIGEQAQAVATPTPSGAPPTVHPTDVVKPPVTPPAAADQIHGHGTSPDLLPNTPDTSPAPNAPSAAAGTVTIEGPHKGHADTLWDALHRSGHSNPDTAKIVNELRAQGVDVDNVHVGQQITLPTDAAPTPAPAAPNVAPPAPVTGSSDALQVGPIGEYNNGGHGGTLSDAANQYLHAHGVQLSGGELQQLLTHPNDGLIAYDHAQQLAHGQAALDTTAMPETYRPYMPPVQYIEELLRRIREADGGAN